MRMRQLGRLQSVLFIAPLDVYTSISEHARKKQGVNSVDVISWTMEQSCLDIETNMPLYVSHGLNHLRNLQANGKLPDTEDDTKEWKELLQEVELPESGTLQQLYGPGSGQSSDEFLRQLNNHDHPFAKRLKNIWENLPADESKLQVSIHEEQERELAVEVEREQEVQRPPTRAALRHSVDPNVVDFIERHSFDPCILDGGQAFCGLRNCSAGKLTGNQILAPTLWASRDFMRTVQMHPAENTDDYLRQVSWILVRHDLDGAFIISPYEADQLLSRIRTSTNAYLLIYAAPTTKAMLKFQSMRFYATPPLPDSWNMEPPLVRQIGIWAGRLYFAFDEYNFLRQEILTMFSESGTNDGQHRRRIVTAILNTWLSIRRKGQDFSQTPMGYLCRNRPLKKDDPFFTQNDDPGTMFLDGECEKLSALDISGV
jgi:hypothetical protein